VLTDPCIVVSLDGPGVRRVIAEDQNGTIGVLDLDGPPGAAD
jgi:hypothetical protein